MELTTNTHCFLTTYTFPPPFTRNIISNHFSTSLNFPTRTPSNSSRPISLIRRCSFICTPSVRQKSPVKQENEKLLWSDANLENFKGLGKWGVLFAVLGCNVIKCRKALAAEGLVASAGGYFKSNWPKILKVLGVFKEQGLILAVLLGLSAFFSMAETSITTLWPWKVRELAEKEPEDGVFRMLRSDVTRFLTTILIGTTVVSIGATALVTEAATKLFGEAGITAATSVMTVAILLLTEITPKSVAVHHATEVARVVVRPVAWLSLVLCPVGRILTFLSMGMLKLLGLKARRVQVKQFALIMFLAIRLYFSQVDVKKALTDTDEGVEAANKLVRSGKEHHPSRLIGRLVRNKESKSKSSTSGDASSFPDHYVSDLTAKIRVQLQQEMDKKIDQKVLEMMQKLSDQNPDLKLKLDDSKEPSEMSTW